MGAESKKLPQVPALFGQWAKSGQPSKTENLDNNHSTPANHHRKNGGPTLTQVSKGRAGSVDFHPRKAVTRCPNIPAARVSDKAKSEGGAKWGAPCQAVTSPVTQRDQQSLTTEVHTSNGGEKGSHNEGEL